MFTPELEKAIFINDNEAETDLLHYGVVARTIIRLIKSSGEQPISIGVHGDWGAGKSTVLALIDEEVKKCAENSKEETKPLCLRFNTWQYQGFEDVKTALLEAIITQVRDKRSTVANVKEQVLEALKQVDYLKLAKKATQWGMTFYTGVPHPEAITGAISAFKAVLEMGHDKITPADIKKSVAEVEGLMKPSSGPKVPEHIEAFKREFRKLIEVAKISKLIILVDDLDRCLPATVIESMEAIRLFLFTERTAFVIAADEAMVQYSVKQHFPDLPNSQGPRSYALNYLEKLIQVPFRIPPLGSVEIQHYITLALTEATLGSNHEAFKGLAGLARERVKEPWNAKRIEPQEIEDALKGQLHNSIKQLILKSDQLHQLLAKGTEGNPRQIKRFLNALLLRREIALARGLEGHIELPVLAKLMLAEYYKDDFYAELERQVFKQPNGAPDLLADFETINKQTKKPKDDGAKVGLETGKESEWKGNEWVQDWVATEPKLSGKDLRPYFFVSRDKKVFFPGMELPNRLTNVVDLLMRKNAALGKSKATALDSKDASLVATEIRGRIISNGEFDKEPLGISGLAVLAETHPQTRVPFLNLLKTLPLESIGGWVGSQLKKLKDYPETSADTNPLLEDWTKKSQRLAAFMQATGTK